MTVTGRVWRSVTATVALVAGVLAWLTGVSTAATPPQAAIRLAWFGADVPGLTARFTAFAGGSTQAVLPTTKGPIAGSYQPLRPGPYAVTLRPDGKALPAALTLNVQPGDAYTVAMLSGSGLLQAVVLHDNLSAAGAGDARVRLVDADVHMGNADVTLADGTVLAHGAGFATVGGYQTVRAGALRVSARSTAAHGGLVGSTLQVAPGSDTTIVLYDTASGAPALRAVRDAAGAAEAPAGPVPAGGGGMAAALTGHVHGPSGMLIGVLEVLGVVVAWGLLHAIAQAVRRRRRNVRTTGAAAEPAAGAPER